MGLMATLTNIDKPCRGRDCDQQASVYAIDPAPDGWGDWYCDDCQPSNWWVIDTIERVSQHETEGDK